MSQENEAVFRRFIEAQNRGDLETMGEILDPDIVDHGASPGALAGFEGVKRAYLEFRADYPDFQYTIEDLLSVGDKVICRWRMRGTHRTTRDPLEVTGINIDRIVNGKIVEHWANHNRVSG